MRPQMPSIYRSTKFTLLPVLLCMVLAGHCAAISAESINNIALDPQALVQRAAANEMRANEARAGQSEQPVRFKLYKESEKGTSTKEIVQTKDGSVARLLSINGKPLTQVQEQAEIARLQRLLEQPEIQEHRRKREQEDADRANKMVKIMPQAFLYTYRGTVQGPSGPAVKLSFQPNPGYEPPDIETRVVTGIAGELWIDKAQERMVRLDAHLFTGVDFGWGIVGRLYKGGSIRIENTDVGNGNWQLVNMKLDLLGKALMLKTLTFRMTENATDFQPVAKEMNYRDAVRLLQSQNMTSAQSPQH
jgi:hypothetical protein